MKKLKRIFPIGVGLMALSLMFFTLVSFNQSNDNLSVEGKWVVTKTFRGANGSIIKKYECIDGGTDCIIGQITYTQVFPRPN